MYVVLSLNKMKMYQSQWKLIHPLTTLSLTRTVRGAGQTIVTKQESTQSLFITPWAVPRLKYSSPNTRDYGAHK